MSAEELAGRVKQFTRRSAEPRVEITKKTRPQPRPQSKPVTLKTVAEKTKFPKNPKLVFTSKEEVRDFKEDRKKSTREFKEYGFNRSQVKGKGQPDFVKGGRVRKGKPPRIPEKVVEKPSRKSILKINAEKIPTIRGGLVKKTKIQKLSSEFAENKRKKLLTTKRTQRTTQRTTSIRKQKRRPRVNGDFTQPNKSQDEINQIFDFRQNRSFF